MIAEHVIPFSPSGALTPSGDARLGATLSPAGVATFVVWAPKADTVDLEIVSPEQRIVPMWNAGDGYFSVDIDGCSAETGYFYRLNGGPGRPDPASKNQPAGVHGPSAVIALPSRPQPDNWSGIPLDDYVIYELHIGTFTREGTFEAVIPHLPRLKDLGITAIEIMPVSEFPGGRNWGYDGVFPFAAEHEYGGIAGFCALVDACHHEGLAVILDVVYNHLGPEGNYFREFAPYFTGRYKTPWGDALNFDGQGSDHVRHFFISNALFWLRDCGVDSLRLDAIHAIYDRSAYPFLQELADSVRDLANRSGRLSYLIAETDLNDPRVVLPASAGGMGLDAQWSDDFHHCLHTLLTGELSGYYQDFGSLAQFARAMQEGWVYSGQYSPLRDRRFGASPGQLQGRQFVVCSQNHDQTGNRMNGERLIHLTGWEPARLAAGAVILSPYIPLLFMGEEYGEPAPFLYHVSHSDPDLQAAVQQGRKAEFSGFLHQGEPPDPQDEATFLGSKLDQSLVEQGMHARLHEWYRELLRVRRTHPAFRSPDKTKTVAETIEDSSTVLVRRLSAAENAVVLLHFSPKVHEVSIYLPAGEWRTLLDSTDKRWGGSASGNGVVQSTGTNLSFTLAPWQCLVLTAAAFS